MSTMTMPTSQSRFGQHWKSGRVKPATRRQPTMSGPSAAAFQKVRWPHLKAGLALVGIVAVGVVTALSAALTPYHGMAARVLEAERIQNLASLREPAPKPEPPMYDLMLPRLQLPLGRASGPPGAHAVGA